MQLEMVELGMTGGSALGVMLVVWLFRSHTRGEPLQTRRSERDDSLNLDPLSERYGKVEGAWRLAETEVALSSGFASSDAGAS
jgi:hypothetical protein